MTWEANWSKRKRGFVWARNRESGLPRCRVWHWVESGKRYVRAGRPPIRKDTWEVDENRPAPTGCRWARNPNSRDSRAKPWHVVSVPNLRLRGVELPTHQNAWEFDWSKRKRIGRTNCVWGRNPKSRVKGSREWKWIPFSLLHFHGIPWVKRSPPPPRIDSCGYRVIPLTAMTPKQRTAAKKYGLYRKGHPIHEHRLIASMKYRRNLAGIVVRHKNGIKTDNRPSNLLIGTYADNTCDHDTARKRAIYWKSRCLRAERKLKELKCLQSQSHPSGDLLAA